MFLQFSINLDLVTKIHCITICNTQQRKQYLIVLWQCEQITEVSSFDMG